MQLSSVKNSNYAAVVVELKHFAPLVGCDNVQAALIFGNQVIVGKDAKPGDIGLYFPVETALAPEFLGANNLYIKPEYGNVDPAKRGFFEKHGRVKCVKFRGHRSEGFWIPLAALKIWANHIKNEEVGRAIISGALGHGELSVGAEFDELAGRKICRKYVPARNPGRLSSNAAPRAKRADRILPGQFAYHIDTAKLDRNIHKLQPSDIISITSKWHGSSAIFAHVLTERPLKWYEKLLVRMGVNIARTEYAHVWASRRVIKGVGGQAREGVVHYYKSDIWGEVFKEVKDLIPKGYTLYGEIVGYTPDGAPIQNEYHYGCAAGQHRFLVYRVTYTNPDGKVLNLSWPQIKEFCAARGLETVKEVYYGYAKGFLPKGAVLIASEDAYPSDWKSGDVLDTGDIVRTQNDEEWQQEFLTVVKNELVEDKLCPHNPGMPAEGVVLRIERGTEFEAYKIKSFAFTSLESGNLDKGVSNLEMEEERAILDCE